MFFVLQDLIPGRTTFKFEYLREFEPEFKIILGYKSGPICGQFMKKPEAENLVLLYL